MSGGGEQALVGKWGRECRMGGGGLTKFSPTGGTPSPPPRKKKLCETKSSNWGDFGLVIKLYRELYTLSPSQPTGNNLTW